VLVVERPDVRLEVGGGHRGEAGEQNCAHDHCADSGRGEVALSVDARLGRAAVHSAHGQSISLPDSFADFQHSTY
jgi:hypothetical protein